MIQDLADGLLKPWSAESGETLTKNQMVGTAIGYTAIGAIASYFFTKKHFTGSF